MEQMPSLFRRSCAKMIDYLSLIAVSIAVASYFSIVFSPLQLIIIGLFVSFAWIPFEVLFLKCFKSTPGHFLMGIKAQRRSKWSTLWTRAIITSVKSFALLFPLFNIFFAWMFVKKEPKPPKYLIKRVGRYLGRAFGWILFFGLIGFSTLEIELEQAPSQATQFVAHQMTKQLNWEEFNHPNNEWVAKFPTKPDTRPLTLKLPSDEVEQVDVQEHFHRDKNGDIEYSISSIAIPHNLMSWGYKLILKGSLKIVVDNVDGAKTIDSKTIRYQGIPTLNYTFEEGNVEHTGRLILVGSTLYRIETSYPKEKKTDIEQELEMFINSINFSSSS